MERDRVELGCLLRVEESDREGERLVGLCLANLKGVRAFDRLVLKRKTESEASKQVPLSARACLSRRTS